MYCKLYLIHNSCYIGYDHIFRDSCIIIGIHFYSARSFCGLCFCAAGPSDSLSIKQFRQCCDLIKFGFFYSLSMYLYVHIPYVSLSHTYTSTPTNCSMLGVMKHHIPFRSNSPAGLGALWKGGSGAVRGGAVKPDVDVLFAQAGQLRSQGLSRYICSKPQSYPNCVSEIKKHQWD